MTTGDDTRERAVADVDTVAVLHFERTAETAAQVRSALSAAYASVESIEYDSDAFEYAFEAFDAIVAIMATGIVVRKVAPLLDSKWSDPAVVALDESLEWAIPLVGGHHGANQLARDLSGAGATATVTTASEIAGKRSVEERAEALDATVATPDSTVATNLAVLEADLGPVARLDGPQAVLVPEDVTVLKRRNQDGVVLGTGCVSGVDAPVCLRAWEEALGAVDYGFDDVEFVATATLKEDEPGLFEAAGQKGLGVVLFEKETLEAFAGPSPSKASELLGWPGIAESSAIAGGRDHELLLKKQSYEDKVTVAVGR